MSWLAGWWLGLFLSMVGRVCPMQAVRSTASVSQFATGSKFYHLAFKKVISYFWQVLLTVYSMTVGNVVKCDDRSSFIRICEES